MNIPTIAYLNFKTGNAPDVVLRHSLSTAKNAQARLSGRQILTPVVRLNEYRFEAVVDWVEFRMHLGRDTQIQHLQTEIRRALGRNCAVELENPGPGNVFSICTITVQAPADTAQVEALHRHLVSVFGEARPCKVTGLEISLDAYPKVPSDDACYLLLGAMQRTIWSHRDIWEKSDSRPRFTYARNRTPEKLCPRPEWTDGPESPLVPYSYLSCPVDVTMYVGARSDDVMIRLMHKVIDEQKYDGTVRSLSKAEQRVRVEVAIRGDELAKLKISDVASLRDLSVAKLQKKYFRFMLPTFEVPRPEPHGIAAILQTQQDWRAKTYLRSGVLGLQLRDTNSESYRKAIAALAHKNALNLKSAPPKFRTAPRCAPPFLVWADLHRIMHVALTCLDKRERTAWGKLGR